MIVAVTGHRPDKLGGYYQPNPVHDAVVKGLKDAFLELKPSCVITGMALGVDQWAAEICAANGIPFVAAVPFDTQESRWPPAAQARFHALIQKAQASYIISPGGYAPQKMHIRNRWMVDSSQVLVAVWDGSPGGTSACVTYAQSVGHPIHYVKLPPEIWALATKMNPKAVVVEQPSEEFSKAVVSPFVSGIKQKAELKMQELKKEAQEHEKTKAEGFFKKLLAKSTAHQAKVEKHVKATEEKTGVQGFGRVLDLDD